MSDILKSCPFCQKPLTVRAGVNAYGRCDTPSCWMEARKIALPLDDPEQVRAWNRRAITASPASHGVVTRAISDIAAERKRQIEAEGWTPEHDDTHKLGELAAAAACYAASAKGHGFILLDRAPSRWPWSLDWWKPADPRRNLVKAGALIAAEIDRLDRAAAPEQEKSNG